MAVFNKVVFGPKEYLECTKANGIWTCKIFDRGNTKTPTNTFTGKSIEIDKAFPDLGHMKALKEGSHHFNLFTKYYQKAIVELEPDGSIKIYPLEKLNKVKKGHTVTKQKTKTAGSTGPSKAKLNKFVLMMAYEQDYRGLDFVSAGIIESALKDLKIPKAKWGEFLVKIQEKPVLEKVEVRGSGMTKKFITKDFIDGKYDDMDYVYLDEGLDGMVEYIGPSGAFNTLGEKGRYLLWLENIRSWAETEFGHFVEVPIEKFVGNDVIATSVTEKENERFAKQAYKDGYLYKSGKMDKNYKLPFAVADEKVWMRLHKSVAFN